MRIAIVLNTSWNIYNFRFGLTRALIENGHEVHAVAPYDEYSEKLVAAGCKHHPVKMDSRGINPIKDVALTIELYTIYKEIRPDRTSSSNGWKECMCEINQQWISTFRLPEIA